MIDQLRAMAIFKEVAERGSFRAAARHLSLSPSVVSHHIAQLEAQIGLPLLYRSTRRLSLTDAGTDLLTASRRMTEAARDGLDAMSNRRTRPMGKLSVTASTALSHPPYVTIFSRFARAYPEIRLSIHINERSVPLEGSGFDVALRGRADDLDDTTYKSRKVGTLPFTIFANPEYVQTRPEPRHIDDLGTWDRIHCAPIPWKTFATSVDGTVPTTEPRIAMECDNFTLARHFVEAGLGFMIETTPLVADDIRTGRLVQILPSHILRPITVYAIYPANAAQTGLARLFAEFMAENLPGDAPD